MSKSGHAHSSQYLGKQMKCTRKSMELVSYVVGFDIVELWTRDEEGNYACTYVHATENILSRYDGIITGHYPSHDQTHVISPVVSHDLCLSRAGERKDGKEKEKQFTYTHSVEYIHTNQCLPSFLLCAFSSA